MPERPICWANGSVLSLQFGCRMECCEVIFSVTRLLMLALLVSLAGTR